MEVTENATQTVWEQNAFIYSFIYYLLFLLLDRYRYLHSLKLLIEYSHLVY